MIVVWRVTTQCNHACKFCAYDQSLPFSRINTDGAQALRIGLLLAEYQQQTGKPVLLSWLGGEPFLWRHLFPVTEHLSAAGLCLSTTTNGSTLGNARHRQWAASHLHELTISIDGDANAHDAVRGTPGGWLKLKTAVQQLAEDCARTDSPLRLRINTVLMHQNIHQFSAQCEEWARWGIQEITFNQLGGRDRPEFYPAHRLLPTDIAYLKSMLPDLRHRLATQGVRLCGQEAYLKRITHSAQNAPYPVDDCAPGEQFIFIDEHGLASPCSFTTNSYGIPIDSWQRWQDVRDLSHTWRSMRTCARSPSCSDCMATHHFEKFQP